MSEELWKYLPHVPQVKKSIVLKRKSEVTDKEVLNLTGGLFPIKLIDTAKNVMSPLSRTLCYFKSWNTGLESLSFSATIKSAPFIIG
jgi:hypothetical protein